MSTIILECVDGFLPVSESVINDWSIKDLIQEGVLSVPYSIEEIESVLYFKNDGLPKGNIYHVRAAKLYKIVHFIGDSDLLLRFRDLALDPSNYQFFVSRDTRREYLDFIFQEVFENKLYMSHLQKSIDNDPDEPRTLPPKNIKGLIQVKVKD